MVSVVLLFLPFFSISGGIGTLSETARAASERAHTGH